MMTYSPRLTKRQLSKEERLRDVQEDLEKLLRHAQALQDENKVLKKAISGSTLMVNDGENRFRKVDLKSTLDLPELKYLRRQTAPSRTRGLSKVVSAASFFSSSSPDLRNVVNTAKFSRCNSSVTDYATSMGDITEVMTEKDMWRQKAKSLQQELLQWKRAAVHSRERTEQVARSPSGPFQTEIQANTLGLLPCGPNFRPHPMVEPSEVCPINVEVISFMKQFGKFVFAIQVTWSDGRKFEVYRRYGEFFSLQSKLLLFFPEEAGKYGSNRIIPALPTMDNFLVVLGRYNSKSMMQSRLLLVNKYCTELLNLPEKITHSKLLMDFFMARPGDMQLESLTSPKSDDGLELEVFPQELDSTVFTEHVATANFDADPTDSSQLSLLAGEIVLLIKEESSGWCFVCKADRSDIGGYVPASFLKKVEDPSESEDEILGFPSPTSTTSSSFTSDDQDPDSQYIAVQAYHTEDSSQLSFPTGAIMDILEKSDDGWWYATYKDQHGWVPMSYLEPCLVVPPRRD